MLKDYKDIPAAYSQAVWDRDSDALLALYDDSVAVYDMWEFWMYGSRSEWSHAVAGWFGSLGAERVAVSYQEAVWHADSGLASYHAFVTYTAHDAQGSPLRSMTNRISWIAIHKGNGWQIIHEHTSSPIQMEGMKVLMTR